MGGVHDLAAGDSVDEIPTWARLSLQSLIDNLPGLVYRCRFEDGCIVEFASNGCLKLTGYHSSELVNRNPSLRQLAHPDDRDALVEKTAAAIRDRRGFQHIYRLVTAAGETKWVWEQGQVVTGADGMQSVLEGFITDITRYKRAEMALRESEQRFRTMADQSPALIWMSDTSKRCTWFNRAWLKFTGRSMEQELGDGWTENIHPDDLPDCLETYHRAFDAREEFVLEYRLRRQDGSYGWVYDAGIPRAMDDGTFEGYIGYCWNITRHVESSAALRLSEHRFRSLFNSTFQYTGLMATDGTLLEANQTALDMIGVSEADVIGKPVWETAWWAHSVEEQERLKAAVKQAASGRLVRYESEHFTPDGRRVIVDFSLKPVIDEHGTTVNIIPEGRDITELKNMELQEKRREREYARMMRLNTIGETASSMAHELNQPLTAIASYCESALQLYRQLPSPPRDLDEILMRAREQALRAGAIIHDLRNTVSRGETAMAPVVFDDVVLRVVDLMKWDLRDGGISIRLDLRAEGRSVLMNQLQIEQVLVNLMRNSMEAIEESGLPDGWISFSTALTEADTLELTLTDSGPGVDDAMLDYLFKPFKSGKETGMGVGLSICRSILESHGGKLWVDRGYHPGARFGFTIRLAEPENVE